MRRVIYLLITVFASLAVFTFCSDDKAAIVEYDLSGQWEHRDTSEYVGLNYGYVAIINHVLYADENNFQYTVYTKDSATVENGEIIDRGYEIYEGTYSTVSGKILFDDPKGQMSDWRGTVANNILYISSTYVDAEYIYDFRFNP